MAWKSKRASAVDYKNYFTPEELEEFTASRARQAAHSASAHAEAQFQECLRSRASSRRSRDKAKKAAASRREDASHDGGKLDCLGTAAHRCH